MLQLDGVEHIAAANLNGEPLRLAGINCSANGIVDQCQIRLIGKRYCLLTLTSSMSLFSADN
ncbi:hypothetical protein QWE_19373 [Agrobacterium albertimagni AOL15]|uniref:Uncharacterized protein n=1 Tax=Agrobacterium albertimagni AOL15 TaxID=1156935 RepID=K2PAH9_9HYPH|nr:hypothetical protein QWE_19373 [Agrobacterium albertimagni AOL15]